MDVADEMEKEVRQELAASIRGRRSAFQCRTCRSSAPPHLAMNAEMRLGLERFGFKGPRIGKRWSSEVR